MIRTVVLAAGCALAFACSSLDSKVSAAANSLRPGMIPREVVGELGAPHRVVDVSPQIREWYYSYSGEADSRIMPNEPNIQWSPRRTSKLIVRFENGEVVSWRKE